MNEGIAEMYIVIEGIDGSGKDTQGDLLAKNLGQDTLRVNEPDDSLPTGQLLRQMLRDGTYVEAHAAMFLADRMAMLSEKVRPALEAGTHVVSVRSWVSTLVYQQETWPLDWLFDIHRMLPCKADHLVVLDLDPDVALDRATRRPGPNEYYEKLDVQKRNRTRYLEVAHQASPLLAEGAQVHIVPATGSVEDVHTDIVQRLHP